MTDFKVEYDADGNGIPFALVDGRWLNLDIDEERWIFNGCQGDNAPIKRVNVGENGVNYCCYDDPGAAAGSTGADCSDGKRAIIDLENHQLDEPKNKKRKLDLPTTNV